MVVENDDEFGYEETSKKNSDNIIDKKKEIFNNNQKQKNKVNIIIFGIFSNFKCEYMLCINYI